MNHRAINPDRKPLAPPATSYLKLLGGPQVETTRDNWGWPQSCWERLGMTDS